MPSFFSFYECFFYKKNYCQVFFFFIQILSKFVRTVSLLYWSKKMVIVYFSYLWNFRVFSG
jgi:hypothetical protein